MSMFDDRSVDVADEPEGEGAELLDQVAAMLGRYIAFPSPATLTAFTLWAAHCHAVAAFESTPRLALRWVPAECASCLPLWSPLRSSC